MAGVTGLGGELGRLRRLGAQVRAARRDLGWSTTRLEGVTGIPASTIAFFERIGHMAASPTGEDRIALLRAVFHDAGLLIDEDGRAVTAVPGPRRRGGRAGMTVRGARPFNE